MRLSEYRLEAAIVLAVAWGVADTATTLWAVDLAGRGAEANPVARWLLANDLFVIAKLIGSTVVIWVGASDIDPADRYWAVVFATLGVGAAVVALSNLIQIWAVVG